MKEKEKEAKKKPEIEKPVNAMEDKLNRLPLSVSYSSVEIVRTLIIAHHFQRGTKRKSIGVLLSHSKFDSDEKVYARLKSKPPTKAYPRKRTHFSARDFFSLSSGKLP